MRIKIFSCHHVAPDIILDTELFQTLVSNVAPDGASRYWSDVSGINIASENDYSELRHQYYIWKNLLDNFDLVGFEHYRRMMFFDPLPIEKLEKLYPSLVAYRRVRFAEQRWLSIDKEAFNSYIEMRRELNAVETNDLKSWMAGFDVITAQPVLTSIESQWMGSHHADVWPAIVSAVRRSSFFSNRPCYVDFDIKVCRWLNCYVMRSDLFGEYLSFAFEVIDILRAQGIHAHRLWGAISERLFNFYLHQKRVENPLLRVTALPVLVHAPT